MALTREEIYPFVFKYIIIGDMGVGKSSILKQFTERKFMRDCPHTVGVEFGTKVMELNGEKIKLQIWDTAGQERFRAVTKSYYRGAAGAILVYDVTRRSSYNHLTQWLADAKSLTSLNTVIMMVGNKTDMESQRDVTHEEAKKFADENDLTFLECSAKTGEHIEDVFVDSCKMVYQKVRDGCNELNSIEGTPIITTESEVPYQVKSNSCAC